MWYRFGDYTLDTNRWELRHTGMVIKLRPKVFDVLTYLIAHRDRVVSRQELLDHLWPQQFVGDTTLNSCIREARQAIGDTGQAQQLIQTLHGRGYRFVAAMAEASESPSEEATRALLALSPASAEGMAASRTAVHTASALEDLRQAMAHPPVPGGEDHAGAKGRSTSSEGLEGERKPVTILCCALADARGLAAHVGSEAMYRLMQAFFALAQHLVRRYAGTLTQRLSDGVVALFGAPSPMKTMPDGRCWPPSSCSSAPMQSPPCMRHCAARPSPPAWDSTAEWLLLAQSGRMLKRSMRRWTTPPTWRTDSSVWRTPTPS